MQADHPHYTWSILDAYSFRAASSRQAIIASTRKGKKEIIEKEYNRPVCVKLHNFFAAHYTKRVSRKRTKRLFVFFF